MLGRHADAFFAKHMSERVLAGTPNGLAQSIAFPDRELAGTGKVQRVSGYYEMPGPQNSVSANAMIPGLGYADALPGMGYADALPGMGYADALPGMGQLDVKRIGMYALIGVGGIMAWRWYQGRQRVAVKVRRSQRRRGRRRRR